MQLRNIQSHPVINPKKKNNKASCSSIHGGNMRIIKITANTCFAGHKED
jgi:hypothetical protein